MNIILDEGVNLEEEIICKICKGIVINPTTCTECEGFFCKTCIDEFMVTHNRCYSGGEYIEAIPHQIYLKLIIKHRFTCPNKKNGCDAVYNYKPMLQHYTNCGYLKMNCKNEFCEQYFLKKDIKEHHDECEFRKRTCEYCNLILLNCDLVLHYMNCRKKPISCPGCKTKMYQSEYNDHEKVCQEIKEKCETCGGMIRRNEMDSHDQLSCAYSKFMVIKENIRQSLERSKKLLTHLSSRVNEQKAFFGNKCFNCGKFACEVSKKSCVVCLKTNCNPCSKKRMHHCSRCNLLACNECFKDEKCVICFDTQKHDIRKPQSTYMNN